jgi:ABC-type dipeptide/oligopeptide/nickel transport system ATPase component
VATGLVVGVPSAISAAYFGGVTDRVCSWVSDALQSIPAMVVLLMVAAGTGADFTVLMVAIVVFMAPGFYRIVRAKALSVRQEPYIDAARVAGVSDVRILGTHMLRAVSGPVLIQAAMTAGIAVGIQAGLQFLGIGSSSRPSWGQMMNDGFQNMLTNPIILVWPSIALGLTTVSMVLIGTTIADLTSQRTERVTRRRRAAPVVSEPDTATAAEPEQSSGNLTCEASSSALRVENLRVSYPTAAGAHEVLHGISVDAAAGEVLGIVGESGSGKSQTVFSVLDLLPAAGDARADGVWVGGRRVDALPAAGRRALLGREIGYIPQEPMSNLDPCYTIEHQLVEPWRRVHGLSKPEARGRARAILERVGITDPDRVLKSYPHQVSGGMAQRVLIAGAVAEQPSLLLADEPTTSLDVTVQAEVLDLLRELKDGYDMTLVIVTHNFGVVADICDRVAVMKDGHIVETGPVEQVFRDPQDPYTAELIRASFDDTKTRAELDAVSVDASKEVRS